MKIVGYVIEVWLAVSVVATFGWITIFELCARVPSRASRPRRGTHLPAQASRARPLLKIVAVPTTGKPLPNESEATRTIPPIRNTDRYVHRAATKPRP